jgi:hypothetical protein
MDKQEEFREFLRSLDTKPREIKDTNYTMWVGAETYPLLKKFWEDVFNTNGDKHPKIIEKK